MPLNTPKQHYMRQSAAFDRPSRIRLRDIFPRAAGGALRFHKIAPLHFHKIMRSLKESDLY